MSSCQSAGNEERPQRRCSNCVVIIDIAKEDLQGDGVTEKDAGIGWRQPSKEEDKGKCDVSHSPL